MEWTIKRCPFCQTSLREEDESYICSACGIPHHTDCWLENNGCITYGCKGKPLNGKPAPEEQNKKDPLPVFFECTRCRTRIPKLSRFCLACGYTLIQEAVPVSVSENVPLTRLASLEVDAIESKIHQEEAGNPPGPSSTHWSSPYADKVEQVASLPSSWKPEYQAYIKKSMDYYRSKFDDLHHERSAWSHPAFWLSTLWFFYRQMYGIGFLSICISCFILFVIPSPLSYILWILFMIICGANGNKWFRNFIDKKVSSSSFNGSDSGSLLHSLAEDPDTNGGAIAVLLCLAVFIAVVAAALQ